MLLVQWIFLPLHTKYFTMYIMTVFLVYNLSIHKTLKQVDCLLTSVKRAVASVPEKQVRVELLIREGIKTWHFLGLLRLKRGEWGCLGR